MNNKIKKYYVFSVCILLLFGCVSKKRSECVGKLYFEKTYQIDKKIGGVEGYYSYKEFTVARDSVLLLDFKLNSNSNYILTEGVLMNKEYPDVLGDTICGKFIVNHEVNMDVSLNDEFHKALSYVRSYNVNIGRGNYIIELYVDLHEGKMAYYGMGIGLLYFKTKDFVISFYGVCDNSIRDSDRKKLINFCTNGGVKL